MTKEEAEAAAEREGLELVTSATQSGYKHVSHDPRSAAAESQKQYKAQVGSTYLGWFTSPEGAALKVARFFRDQPPPPSVGKKRGAAAAAATTTTTYSKADGKKRAPPSAAPDPGDDSDSD